MKKYIYSALCLSLALSSSLTSCEDMLDPESDLVMYEEDNRLNTANDTLYSVLGAIHLIRQVADRTIILGEVRGDLSSLTDKASTDLQELASFTATETNAYNNPQDYYAIINNCNYFIANADSAYKKQGVKVFEKELAVMHTFRAWAYLQLCLNYGRVPFYTDFLGTQAAGEAIMRQPYKDVKEICNCLIDDLSPWQSVRPLIYESSFGGFRSTDITIPTKLMLGELCLWAERYTEAAQYYHDFLTDVDNPLPVYYNQAAWIWYPGDPLPSDNRMVNDTYSASGQITVIPMETSSFYGSYSKLIDLFSSTQDNNYYNEIETSESAIEQSAEQSYYTVFMNEMMQRDTLRIDADSILANVSDRTLLGDLRLNSNVSISENRNKKSDKDNTLSIINNKYRTRQYVTLYRTSTVYLHFAEALNRAGFPTAAFAVLKYGLCEDNTINRAEGDPIAASEREKAGTLLTFNPADFSRINTMGLHARGCGDVDANPEYVIPELTTESEIIEWVEDKIVEELALETIFEGQRYYDLMRVAIRRGDNNYLADKIAARNGKNNVDAGLKALLSDSKNWYLPLRK